MYYTRSVLSQEFDCKGRVERCERKKAAVRRPVCGTDNISYPSRCALLRVRCFNDSLLRVKHRGRCKGKTLETSVCIVTVFNFKDLILLFFFLIFFVLNFSKSGKCLFFIRIVGVRQVNDG